MIKKVTLLIFLGIMFLVVKVDAANYNMTLNTATQEVVKDSVVDINITLDNINGINSGLNVCEFNLEYNSSKIQIIKDQSTNNSLIGQNDWNGTEGQNIVWEKSVGFTTTRTDIAKIRVKILDTASISLTNINCTNGEYEFATNGHTLNFTIKQEQIQNNVNNNQNNVNNNQGNAGEYNTSQTTEPSKTGVEELTLVFMLIALVSFVLIKFISRNDLFKKI